MLFYLFSFIVVYSRRLSLKMLFGKKTLMTKDEFIAKNVILCHVHFLHNP